jgi:predicted enzyme related to lactoylglutathione lyase
MGAAVITGAHTIIYTEDADAARAFFRDVLEWPHVDAHGGWLIFKLPPGELALHPTGPGTGKHELYLMCDDLASTVAELTARGAEFTGGVTEEQWGSLTSLRIPGGGTLGLYEPHHPVAHSL